MMSTPSLGLSTNPPLRGGIQFQAHQIGARILYRNDTPVDMWPQARMSAAVRYGRGSRPTKLRRAPHRLDQDLEASRRRAEASRVRVKRKGDQLQQPAVAVAKKSSPAVGGPAMITRSKLVEQLRDYQIRSQHK
jgi:hypothetical protein